MKIVTLLENEPGTAGIPGEHGLGLYVETGRHRLISDTGASDLTWQNARALGIDVSLTDTIIISHGHYDHAGGVMTLASLAPCADIYMRRGSDGDFFHGDKYIGIDKRIISLPRLCLTDGNTVIDDELFLFTGTDGKRPIPEGNRELTELKNGVKSPDVFDHEQYLVITENGRRTLISGCAHNGILNILDRYHDLFGEYPYRVISGFHMMNKNGLTESDISLIRETARELSSLPTLFYTGHCTGEPAYLIMKEIMGDNLFRIRSGDVIEDEI